MMYDALPPARNVAPAANHSTTLAELLYITTPDHPFWAGYRAFKFYC